MAQRPRRTKFERRHIHLIVAGVAVSVRRLEPSQSQAVPSGTSIRIEGQSNGLATNEMRDTLLLVSPVSASMNVLGHALGGKTPWTVSCNLFRDQFADVLAMVLAGRLQYVDMAFDQIRWHKGTLLSINFATRPLQSEAEL
jgi:hypothetical protein